MWSVKGCLYLKLQCSWLGSVTFKVGKWSLFELCIRYLLPMQVSFNNRKVFVCALAFIWSVKAETLKYWKIQGPMSTITCLWEPFIQEKHKEGLNPHGLGSERFPFLVFCPFLKIRELTFGIKIEWHFIIGETNIIL